MKKELKFGDAEQSCEEAKKIANAGDVKSFIDRIHKVEETMDMAKADLKALYGDAKDQGIDPKALKVVVKHRKRPVSFEHRQEVNELLDKVGDLPLFAAISQ